MSQLQGDGPKSSVRVLRWESVPQPVRILVYLLLALVTIEVYHQANFIVARVFNVVILFVFAAVIALLLTPLIDRVEHTSWIHGRRGMAVGIVNLGLLALIVGGVAILVPLAGQQVKDFRDAGPGLYSQATAFLSNYSADFARFGISIDVRTLGTSMISTEVVNNAVQAITGAVSAVISILLVTVISIYLEAQGRELVASVRRLFHQHQEQVDFFFVATGSTVAAYVRGQLIMALLISVYSGVALSVFGIHYAFVIAIAIFFLEFLPLIGAPVGMGLAALIALFQGPVYAAEALGIGVFGHVIEAYIVGPRIAGRATRLHPLAAMVALLIGADLGGLLGALFAVPIAGVINVYLGAMYKASQGDEEAFALPEHRDATMEDLPRLGEEISEVKEEGLEAEPMPRAIADRPPRRRTPAKPAAPKRRRPAPRTTGP